MVTGGGRPRVWNIRDPNCPKDAIYGGRSMPGHPSEGFGNPFRIGHDGDREAVIGKYCAWLCTQPELVARIQEMRGRDWACWCIPSLCHCSVNLLLANE